MKDKFTETDFKVKLINQRRSKNNNIGKWNILDQQLSDPAW
jgi:hypothetical protein